MGSGLSGMYQLVLGLVGGLLKRYGTNAKTSNRMDAHGKHGVSCAVDIYAKLNIKKNMCNGNTYHHGNAWLLSWRILDSQEVIKRRKTKRLCYRHDGQTK